MLHHQTVSNHHPESLRQTLLKAKRANSGKKADANLRAVACRAVAAGLTVSEVATATGYCTATLKRWLAEKPETGVRLLPIVEEPAAVRPVPRDGDTPIASLEFGSFLIRLYSR